MAPSPQEGSQPSLIPELREGTDAMPPLTVLVSEEPLFFYESNGQMAGLEYEILNYFAKSLGRRLEVKFIEEFTDVLPSLANGEGDIVAATLTITPERESQFDFSTSYFPVRVMLIEKRTVETLSLEALEGSVLATQKGTTYETLLKSVKDGNLIYGETERDLLELVASGQARATAVDSTYALAMLPDFPDLHMTLGLTNEQNYGFAVAQGSSLGPQLVYHMSQLKKSRIYFRLLEKYFGRAALRMVSTAKNPEG